MMSIPGKNMSEGYISKISVEGHHDKLLLVMINTVVGREYWRYGELERVVT